MRTVFFKQGIRISKTLLSVYVWLISSLLFYSEHLAAISFSYQLNEIAQLNHHGSDRKTWLNILANPSNKHQYFAMNDVGELYVFTDAITSPPALNIADEQGEKTANVTLAAIALHPNFSLRDQVGYGLFYTAHFEAINPNSNTSRIEAQDEGLTLTLDAVITQWQFSLVNHQQVDLTTKREVFRMAVPDDSFSIAQMSFNPVSKSWNDDFGLLHISLSGDKKWSQPLYSGVILRINPLEFGLRSYTVPSNNPFLKNKHIHDAIYLLGGQKIQQFFWPDKNNNQLLVVHHYNQQQQLSLTKGGDDWRTQASTEIFYQTEETINDVIIYQGRELSNLIGKPLLLKRHNQQWVIESLILTHSDSTLNHAAARTELVWEFPEQQLPLPSQPKFIEDLSGELFLLDNHQNRLYQISQESVNTTVENIDAQSESVVLPSEEDDDNTSYTLLLFILMLIAGGYYFLKETQFAARKLIRKQYAQFELSQSKQQIGLFKRHQQSAELVLDLVDIICSEVIFNDQIINTMNDNGEQGFSQNKEQALRAIFTKEYANKMVKGKVRQINLLLTDKYKKCYVICLYLRKGSKRITKKSYFKAIDDLIDFCWLIAEQKYPVQTGERKPKPVVNAHDALETISKATDLNLSDEQHTVIQPVINQNTDKPTLIETIAAKVKSQNEKEMVTPTPKINKDSGENKPGQATVDVELVNTLEKLVDLKQQGYLTAEEFNLAKTKLFKNLFD